jgi:hypothetical protein
MAVAEALEAARTRVMVERYMSNLAAAAAAAEQEEEEEEEGLLERERVFVEKRVCV